MTNTLCILGPRPYYRFWGSVLLLLISAALLGCGDSTGSKDTTPPTVVSVSPVSDAVDVSVDIEIFVYFSEGINLSTVSDQTFYIDGLFSDDVFPNTASARLKPLAALSYDTEYEVVVGRAIRDLAGNSLASEYRWSFRTESNPSLRSPGVIATVPTSGATGFDAAAPIIVTFNKTMDPASFADSSIKLTPSAAGTVVMVDSTATFTPDDTLLFLTTYTATISAAVQDTSGNPMTASYQWSFTTGTDPMIPEAEIISPLYDDIIGDSVLIEVATDHPVGVTLVEFYIDGSHVVAADDSAPPFEYAWDASTLVIGSVHSISLVAYEAGGRIGYSDTVQVTFQWEKLLATNDNQDDWPVDIRMAYYRSTDSLLEFRFAMWENWSDDPINDTALDLGIYLDTDLSATTGRTYWPDNQHLLNGIGGDYQLIIGLHGLDALRQYNNLSEQWELIYDPTGFDYINLPPDTNVFEVGLKWSDIGSPSNVRIVAINVFFISEDAFIPDWVPDEGAGYLLLSHQNRYIGEGYQGETAKRGQFEFRRASKYDDPFTSVGRSTR